MLRWLAAIKRPDALKTLCNHITVELIRVIRLGPFKRRQIVGKRPAPAVAKTALALDSGLWLMPHYICRQNASPRIQSPSLQPLSGFDNDFARYNKRLFTKNVFRHSRFRRAKLMSVRPAKMHPLTRESPIDESHERPAILLV